MKRYGKPLPVKRDVQAHLNFYAQVNEAAKQEGVKMKNCISFDNLRKVNVLRMEYFGHGDLATGWNVAEWGCALAGETGELCNILKKINRNAGFDPSYNELRHLAAEEIADVAIYLDLISSKLGLHLDGCIKRKFNQTSEKHGFPHRL